MILDSLLRRLVAHGSIRARYPNRTERTYGDGGPPRAGLILKSRRAERRLVWDPGLALGELYMEGLLVPMDCEIVDVIAVLMHNLTLGRTHPTERLMRAMRHGRRWIDQWNPADRSKRNVAHHYDLDGRLYDQFLDRDRQYSCAYFRTGQETLDEAQEAKKRHIASKLLLDRPGMEVLDIGCGWGGMALTLARDYGAKVTGITLSEEQLATARARAAEAGLADRVRFELMDYRAWSRPMDRVVSVGMFEHVGIAQYGRFFRTIRRTLKPDGVALIHAIGRSEGPGVTNPWLAKYIFPGGYSPAFSEVMPAIEKIGLWMTDLEILRMHYAETLRHWRERFAASRERIKALYDERFCRMFEFYLAGSEVAFRWSDHMVWQVQLSPSRVAVPLTRDYMFEAERSAPGQTRAAA